MALLYRLTEVRENDFDSQAETAALQEAVGPCGALVSFMGCVRSDGGVEELYLEHYPGMTERSLEAIVDRAEKRWPLLGLALIHRVGKLRPGDPIVLALTACAHRKPAYEANMFLMDSLKTDAIFWKRERRSTPDGSQAHWVESKAADFNAAEKWQKLLERNPMK